MAREIRVNFVGDDDQLHKTFKHAGDGASSLWGTLAKGTLVVAGVSKALELVGSAARIGFAEFNEGQKVAAQTGAVLTSTGGAANVTAKHVNTLAGALMQMSGQDDEAIASGENMLLTFTKIRNETGKGNDVFDQATKATLNLSVAMGKDMQGSAILVGKALNDPLKGMTALNKAGIQFTQDQKDTIKTMVESGNTMGAQKLILGELETQFGGSAKAVGGTFGGQINVAKETLKNFAGEIVGATVPALAGGLTKINEFIPVIATFAGGFIDRAKPAISAVVAVIKADMIPFMEKMANVWLSSIKAIAAVIAAHKPEIMAIFDNLVAVFKDIISILDATLLPLLKFAFTTVLPVALQVAIPIIKLLSGAFKLVADVLVDVADGIRWLASHVVSILETIKEGGGAALAGLRAAFNLLKDTVLTVVGVYLTVVDKFLGGFQLLAGAASHIPLIGGMFKGVAAEIGVAREKISQLKDAIEGLKSKDITVTTHIREVKEAYNQRAFGGPIDAGQTYLVGERGPELFVSDRGGSIVPNDRLTAGARGSSPLLNIENYNAVGPHDAELLASAVMRRLAVAR